VYFCSLPVADILCWCGTFVTTDVPALMNYSVELHLLFRFPEFLFSVLFSVSESVWLFELK
jgi:hypothetical protein